MTKITNPNAMPDRPNLPTAAKRPLPLAVRQALIHDDAAERAALETVWNDAVRALDAEPSEATFRAMGSAIWETLEQETVRPPARSLRLVHLTRYVAVAASVLLLVAVGWLWWSQPLVVVAPAGETVAVDLPDGSVVTLNSGSALTYPRTFATDQRLVHLEGEAFFDVTKSETPFIAQTFNADVRVLGTTFNVRAYPDDPMPATEVALVTGKVQLEARGRATAAVTLAPGQTSMLAQHDTIPAAPRPALLNQVLAWQSGRLVFDNAMLGRILNEMERHYAVDIDVSPASLRDSLLTLTFSQDRTVETILQDIALMKGFVVRQSGGTSFELVQSTPE